jgi:hypothetical protein
MTIIQGLNRSVTTFSLRGSTQRRHHGIPNRLVQEASRAGSDADGPKKLRAAGIIGDRACPPATNLQKRSEQTS